MNIFRGITAALLAGMSILCSIAIIPLASIGALIGCMIKQMCRFSNWGLNTGRSLITCIREEDGLKGEDH